jgi:hypothetical protein
MCVKSLEKFGEMLIGYKSDSSQKGSYPRPLYGMVVGMRMVRIRVEGGSG